MQHQSSKFIPGFSPPNNSAEKRYVVFAQQNILVLPDQRGSWAPIDEEQRNHLGLTESIANYLGEYNGCACYMIQVEEARTFSFAETWESARGLLVRGALDEASFALISCGLQVNHWQRDHRFCGRCGKPTEFHVSERARVCTSCDVHYYPRLSPCIITVITRGEECLLARNKKFPDGLYSALAGFIEPGETVEGALHREVKEEVGIDVQDLRYFGSQPWPFPGQLMIGFHADYHSGDIIVDGDEITDARWWHFSELPQVPPGRTLSGQLIRHFVEQNTGAKE